MGEATFYYLIDCGRGTIYTLAIHFERGGGIWTLYLRHACNYYRYWALPDLFFKKRHSEGLVKIKHNKKAPNHRGFFYASPVGPKFNGIAGCS